MIAFSVSSVLFLDNVTELHVLVVGLDFAAWNGFGTLEGLDGCCVLFCQRKAPLQLP